MYIYIISLCTYRDSNRGDHCHRWGIGRRGKEREKALAVCWWSNRKWWIGRYVCILHILTCVYYMSFISLVIPGERSISCNDFIIVGNLLYLMIIEVLIFILLILRHFSGTEETTPWGFWWSCRNLWIGRYVCILHILTCVYYISILHVM
jgi:hypothetical protein